MRRTAVIGVVLVVMAMFFLGGTSLFASPTDEGLRGAENATTPGDRDLVRPTGGESGFWPYLSTHRGFKKQSPINVVVVGDADRVGRALVESGDTNWEETDNESIEADADTYTL